MAQKLDRRTFLKASAASAAGVALPAFSIGQSGPSANSKLNIAMVGAGNIAAMAYWSINNTQDNIVALADVDENMFLQHAKDFPQLKKAKKFKDFRVMLDEMDDEIDAVCINTPDHTHFVATLAAMERGKHVITQKPLTHNIWEAQTLQKAKHKYGVVTNMAVQGHTYNGIRQMREWYEADVFGQITEVRSFFGGPGWRDFDGDPNNNHYFMRPEVTPPEAQVVPDHFDWDLWKGPSTTDLPYHGVYHPKSWRGYFPFGNGLIGDWLVHVSNAAVWILDLYDPVSVELESVHGGSDVVVPDANVVRWDFERRGDKAPCTFYWHNGWGKYMPEKPESWGWGDKLPAGTLYYGEKQIGHTDLRSDKPRLADREAMREFKESGYPDEVYPRIKDGPFGEWLRAIKGDGPEPGANFDFASPFTVMSLLGALVMRHGGRIEWDAKNQQITNRPELMAYVKPEVRPGWEFGQDLW